MIPKGSRRLAWFIVGITTVLTAYAIFQGLEGAASAMFSTGIIAGPALYASKQHQERKTLEIQKNSQNGKSEHEKNS